MPLAAGTKLGPYEIVAPLGAGGMGEVYRARDSRLGREVAVKVLAQHLSADAEVRARFEREARTVSALNHPHICVLHDVGRASDDSGPGAVDYLVMELVEGETLAARLARGPLPPAEVLRLGAQVADALDRAHRAGVVHRDLKPGNVMLTKSGAKLMDFGLARATGLAAGGASDMTQSPTAAAPLTAEGTIVGTFQYMAPEQLEGREADARADLWALGCVLYEMATGRRAFEGRSQASLVAAIMHVEPAPLSQAAPLAPPALERVVSACLAKDPADRIQSAHDVRLQLGWIAESGVSPGFGAAPPGAAAPPRRAWLAPVAVTAGALGLAAALAVTWWSGSRREPTVVTHLPLPRGFVLGQFQNTVQISPDGRSLLAGGRGGKAPQAWLWSLDSPEPRPLPATAGGGFWCWSPDSRSIAFLSAASRALLRMSASGDGATRIAGISDGRGLSWGAKDVIVYAPSASGPLYKVPATGGPPEPATELDASRGEASHRFPCFLPDGEHFLFAALPGGPDGYTIRVGSLRSKQSKIVMETRSGCLWAAPGYLVFVEDGKLVAQRFDLGRLSTTGVKSVLGDGPPPTNMDADIPASASRTGRLAFAWRPPAEGRLSWLDRAGRTVDTVAVQPGAWTLSSLSPDRSAALAVLGREVRQVDLARGVSTPLEGFIIDGWSLWSPDGRRVLGGIRGEGGAKLLILNSGGTGRPDTVPGEPALFLDPRGWAPDGRSLLVGVLGRLRTGAATNTSWDLWVFPLDGSAPRPWVAGPGFERLAALSPDGRRAAYFAHAEDGLELYVDSYPDPGHRVQVATLPLSPSPYLGWGREGREILYVDRAGDLVAVAVTPEGDGVRLGLPVRLFHVPADVTSITTRDGERFLVSRDPASTTSSAVRLVQGWPGLLKP